MPTSPPTWIWAIALIGCAALVAGCGPIASPGTDVASPHAAQADEEDVPITEADVKMPADYAAVADRVEAALASLAGVLEKSNDTP